MKILTHGCTSGEIINLERNTTEAATREGKNLKQS